MNHLATLLLILLLSACGEGPPSPSAQEEPATPVSVVELAQIAVYPLLTAQAQVTSRNIARVAAQITATVQSLPIEAGQLLSSGTVVARLDCTDYRIALDQARANQAAANAQLELAEQQLKRAQDLASRDFIAGDTLDQRRAEVKVARAQRHLQTQLVSGAERNVSKCILTAPFPALVESRLGNEGELATPGTPLALLWDTSGLEVVAQVQSQDAEPLSQASHIELVTASGRYPLSLKRLSSAQSLPSRTQEARLAFSGTPPNPGASGVIQWRHHQPHLPPDYLLTRDGRLGCFVAEQQRARFLPLPDAHEGRPAAIALPTDSLLIGEERFTLSDGQSVSLK